MKAQNKKYGKMLFISIILLICSILFTLMPHLHECSDVECSLCDFAKTLKESLVLLASLFISLLGISLLTSVLHRCDITVYPRSNTLVGRKVKLSD